MAPNTLAEEQFARNRRVTKTIPDVWTFYFVLLFTNFDSQLKKDVDSNTEANKRQAIIMQDLALQVLNKIGAVSGIAPVSDNRTLYVASQKGETILQEWVKKKQKQQQQQKLRLQYL